MDESNKNKWYIILQIAKVIITALAGYFGGMATAVLSAMMMQPIINP